MVRFHFFAILFTGLTAIPGMADAQQQLKSKMIDGSTGKSLAGVTVKVYSNTDTLKALHTVVSDQQGLLVLDGVSKGDFLLKANLLGYKAFKLYFSQPAGQFGPLPASISLYSESTQLKEVAIVKEVPPIRMKGDTIEYNADKFKTKENAVVEDLLRKLPGVNVERDGSIKAQGEQVQRVLVDGKEFFGSDPSIATRNLPADMIDKVQILDKKSDLSEFTGVADGNQVKTINLVTKKNRKRGYFGNASAGAGTSGTYEGGINANSFVGDMQLSTLLKGNNVNKSGFSATELIRLLSQDKDMFNNLPPSALSELMRMKGVTMQGSPDALAEIARPVGLTDTKFGGLNFNNDWGKDIQFRSSYFFNNNQTSNDFDYARQYLLQNNAYNYNQMGSVSDRNTNHRIDLSGDIKLGEMTSLKVTPHLNFSQTESNNSRNFRSTSPDGTKLLNQGSQTSSNDGRHSLLNSGILLRQRFSKKGRTLAVNLSPELYQNKNLLYNQSNSIYNDPVLGSRTENIDQQTANHSDVYSLNTNVLFTEPLFKSNSLQIGNQLYYSHGTYDRLVNNKDAAGRYGNLDFDLSDVFSSRRLQYTAKLSLAGNYKNFLYTIGLGWQQNNIRGNSSMKNYLVQGHYNDLLPDAYAELKTSKTDKLIFRYNAAATAPTISNLQPLTDNTDPVYTRRGNSGLQQKKSQQLSLSFNHFNTGSGNNLYARAGFTRLDRDIADSITTDLNSGKQLIIPVNVKGNYQASVSAGQSIKVDGNGSSLSADVNFAYTRSVVFNNGLANENKVLSLTPGFNFNYYLGSSISLTARGSAAWNVRRFTGASALPEKNWLLMYSLEGTILLPYKFTLEPTIDAFSTLGMASGFNNNIVLLNTAISRPLGKHFTLQAQAKDLLNKNQSLNRITGNGYIEDRKNNTLGKYYLFSLIYKFRHFPKAKA
ncbi:outer membrane beta-barrel protein [Pedobacter nutrimenti]|nr:outer membrane beta-barrel protein [Pedobacter nutrimenti]